MAPNLKKLSLLADDSFLDVSLSLLAAKGQGGGSAAAAHHAEGPAQPQVLVRGNEASASYWDWPAPSTTTTTTTNESSPAAIDLFSAEHLQSNLIRAAAERAASKTEEEDEEAAVVVAFPLADTEDYWAERSEPLQVEETEEVATKTTFIKVPQHHPLNLQVSSSDYWRDARGERLESDNYWSTTKTPTQASTKAAVKALPARVYADIGSRELSDQYWDESFRHAPTFSDAYWSTDSRHSAATDLPAPLVASSMVPRAAPADLPNDSHRRWVWSHEPTESDRYWAWETSPVAPHSPAVLTC
jgi:hypothetical protein